MADAELLEMLRANLQMVTTAHDTYLTQLIGAAREAIAREGIELEDTVGDNNLIVMYAAYLYRDRVTGTAGDNTYTTAAHSAKGMPKMLRYALNQRLFAAKGTDS